MNNQHNVTDDYLISAKETCSKPRSLGTAITVYPECLPSTYSAYSASFHNKITTEMFEKIRSYAQESDIVEYLEEGLFRILTRDDEQSDTVKTLYNKLVYKLNGPISIDDCLIYSKVNISVKPIRNQANKNY